MALTRRVWGAGKLLFVSAALLVTYFVFFAVAMRVALKAREVAVPALTGRTVNEATAVLSELDLALHVEDARRADPRVPAGRVLAQEPAGGVVTRRSRTVKVWLSEGPAVATVPALVGESERTAQLRAQADALAVEGVAEIRSADYAPGVVVAQSPGPRARSAGVRLLVNRGESGQRFVMPDLIGLNAVNVAALLRSQGFRVAVVGEQPYPDVPPGTVVRQRPAGGFQIGLGDAISLEVSR
jgi:serine/threonine-protein kinase